MPIANGTRIGPYEVTASLGRGGMGEVYRATDTRLGREVAIKFSAERFSDRFEREAQAVAALNHPNICTLYDVAADYLVMELVDGPTLAERIAEGAIPLEEALEIARQIAAALEEAHDKGITHRDLKPGNIKITADGTIKVLDFGLAKISRAGGTAQAGDARFGDITQSPTLSIVATQIGVILGTAAYMSPEQAKGKPVDKRADIWAFGVILYEMLTGRLPFRGDDVGDVLAAVIRDDPVWDDVPARTQRLLQLCLEKDPKKRLRDISSVSLVLDAAWSDAATRRRSSPLAWALVGLLAVVAMIGLWAPWRRPVTNDRPLLRLDVDLGTGVSLGSPLGTDVIISPDGHRLVWVSQGRLYTRRLDQPEAVELQDTQGASAPFFSPDGQWVAYFAATKLRKISVHGGASIALCDAVAGRGGSWGEDGYIVAALAGGVLSRIPEAGGAPTPLTERAEGETADHRWPHTLPGSEAVLFTARATITSVDDANIDVKSMRDGRRKTLLRGAFARYIPRTNGTGYLLYVNRGTLFAVSFDAGRLEVRGTPSPVLEGVGFNPISGGAQFDTSKTGTLVYRGGGAGSLVSLQWLDAAGEMQPLPAKPGSYTQPHLSPDGKLLTLSVVNGSGQDIWVYDWQRDAMSRLTFGGGTYFWPVWSKDGRYIVFTGGFGAGGMLWTRADGATRPQPLTQSKNGQFPWSFSPDGKRLAYADFPGGVGSGDIWTVSIEADETGLKAGKPEVFLQTPANELYPAFSPDGRWIAYRSEESGSSEIYVRAFPDKGGKWLISNNGGVVAVWSPNGRELFYRTADQRVMVVNYTTKGDVFVADRARPWTEIRMAETGTGQNFDIAPDGKRLLVMMQADASGDRTSQSRVIFLQNFSDEVSRRVGGAR